MSRTSCPSSRSVAAVPPVETSSTPRLREAGGQLVEAGLVGKRKQRPADGHEVGHSKSFLIQLERRNCQAISPPRADDFARRSPVAVVGTRLAAAVDQRGFPRPAASRRGSGNSTAARPASAGSRPCRRRSPSPRRPGRDGSGSRRAQPRGSSRRPFGDQLVLAAHFLAVVAEHQAALVDQAEAADIAVVAGLEPAAVIVLAAVDGRRRSTPLPSVPSARIAVELVSPSDQRRMRGGGAQRLRPVRAAARSAAAPGPPQLTTSRCAPSRHFERQRRGAAASQPSAAAAAARRR